MIYFIFLLLLLLQPYNKNVLGCGLIGFVPNKGRKANTDWIKLIMAYNAERGTDSCGVYMNGDLAKGTGVNSDIRDFMCIHPIAYDDSSKNNLILAHARKSSIAGSHTAANAHPFRFENEAKNKTIIFAHNGTLTNHFAFTTEFGLPDLWKLDVDSQKLATVILEKGYDVLKFYKGTAALLWTFEEEPNVMYCFKGASRNRHNGPVEDERPLTYITTEEGIYISSIRTPLDACCNGEITVYTPCENVVYRIENNKFTEVVKIDREDSNVVFHTPTRTTNANIAVTGGANQEAATIVVTGKTIKIKSPFQIYDEVTNPAKYSHGITRVVSDKIYYLGGRYYTLNHTEAAAYNRSNQNFSIDSDESNFNLIHGEVSLYSATITINGENEIAAYLSRSLSNSAATAHYFYEGVLIEQSKVDKFKKRIKAVLDKLKNPMEKLRQLSAYSKYPITYTFDNYQKIDNQYILYHLNGRVMNASMTFCPLWSNRIYSIDNKGRLVSITSKLKNDNILATDYSDDAYGYSDNYEDVDITRNDDGTITLFTYPSPSESNIKTLMRVVYNENEAETKASINETRNILDQASWYYSDDWRACAKGSEILKRAIYNLTVTMLSDSGLIYDTSIDEYVTEKTKKVYNEGIASEYGLKDFIETNMPSINFMVYVKYAAHELLLKDLETGNGSTSVLSE